MERNLSTVRHSSSAPASASGRAVPLTRRAAVSAGLLAIGALTTLAAGAALSGCQAAGSGTPGGSGASDVSDGSPQPAPDGDRQPTVAERFNADLLAACAGLPRSELLDFGDGLTVTGLGVTYDGRPTAFDGCYYFPAIEALTGAHVAIDWQDADGYASTVAATLIGGTQGMPDILNPMDFGVMDLADDGLIVALDDYLDLMPHIVEAVGPQRMDAWRAADGHIYTIPSVSAIRGSFSMMVRRDWLDALGMDEPQTWDDWLAYWRAVRDGDLNGNGDPADEAPFALVQSADGERSLTLLLNAFGIAASNDTQFCLLDDGTYTMVYEHPRYPEFLEAAEGLYAEGLLVEGFESFSYASVDRAMADNTLGSAMTFAASASQAQGLRDAGVKDALWVCTPPLPGPHGDRMIQERELVSPTWCITAGARERGKVEDIVRFFDWCFSPEGAALYNYGIEGVSYKVVDGAPVLDPELVANGFADVRAVGINYEPFGGYWLQDAYMQCLFAGKTVDELTDMQRQTYSGLFEVNEGFFYTQPPTVETPSYVKHRTALITQGVCKLRDRAIRGEISLEKFWEGYADLKEKGLDEVIADGAALYSALASGSVRA